MIEPHSLPLLRSLCWDLQIGCHELSDEDKLARYERGLESHYVASEVHSEELEFIRYLADKFGSWLAADTHAQNNKISHILSSLDNEILKACEVQLSSNNVNPLLYHGLRNSEGVKMLCPLGSGYHKLRSELFDAMHDPVILFSHTDGIELPRDVTANQYGIRLPVKVDDTIIKFEIVAEARILLEAPEFHDFSPGTPCLTYIDRFAEKLLANTDRWSDKSVESRDLIDLGVMRAIEGWSEKGAQKADSAYPVIAPLERAIESFLANKAYQDKCFNVLEMEPDSIELALKGIDMLGTDIHDRGHSITRKP